MQAVGVKNIAHPIDTNGERFDPDIVLAPERGADVVEKTQRTAEPEREIPRQSI